MTNVLVRNCTREDLDEVAALLDTNLPYDAPHNNPANATARKLDFDDGLFFVAITEDSITGTVMAGYDGHRGWIYSLAVEPSQRRRGIATALVERAETALRERGCPKTRSPLMIPARPRAWRFCSVTRRAEQRLLEI